MRTLENQFSMAPDKGGLFDYSLVKRDGDVAIYERTKSNKEGKVSGNREYEIFLVKKRFKGQPLPGGMFEKEDRECYPGKESFGKTAFFCNSLERAEERFNELKEKNNDAQARKEEAILTGSETKRGRKKKVVKEVEVKTEDNALPKKRGRQSLDRTTLSFPTGEWTMKQAHELNPFCCHATVYHYVKSMVDAGKMQVCGSVTGGRGKAKLMYRMVEPETQTGSSNAKDETPF